MDYLTIEGNEVGKDVHIVVITDHFTHFAQAIVTTSQTENVQPKIYGTNLLSIMGSLRKS